MSDSLAFLNGRIIPAGELRISPLDAGFVWGATATDRIRTYAHRPYLLAEHVARFGRTAELCRVPLAAVDLIPPAEQLIEHNAALLPESEELFLILLATPGECARPTLAMHTVPLDADAYRPLLARGAKLVVPSIRHVPARCQPPTAKMRSRLFWWLAEQEAHAVDPESSALLLDLAGCVTETAAANFLIVQNKVVVSPPRSAVLDGISLGVVEELCREVGLAFVERSFDLDACYGADEALLTSTPYGVAGVSLLNGRPVPWPGPVLGQLHDAWCGRLRQEIWRPVLAGR
ncbi:MAG: aminotransferase class IV [Gemmataceae bacterium]